MFEKGWHENSSLNGIYSFIPAEDSSGISPWNLDQGRNLIFHRERRWSRKTWEKKGNKGVNMENSRDFFPIFGIGWLNLGGLDAHRDPGVG